MKAVLMLYPINEFLRGDPKFPNIPHMNLNTFEAFWSRTLPSEGVMKRYGLINTLLDQYREEDYVVHWAFFSKPDDSQSPDLSSLSDDVFVMGRDDRTVNVGITAEDHFARLKYPRAKKVLRSLLPLDELVVGGFHHDDCVPRFVEAATTLGVRAHRDGLLTDLFFRSVNRSFGQDVDAYMLANGSLDPAMHEDDPLIEMCALFGGRLDKELAVLEVTKSA